MFKTDRVAFYPDGTWDEPEGPVSANQVPTGTFMFYPTQKYQMTWARTSVEASGRNVWNSISEDLVPAQYRAHILLMQ